MNGGTPAKVFADRLPKTTKQKEDNKQSRQAARHRQLKAKLTADCPLCTIIILMLAYILPIGICESQFPII